MSFANANDMQIILEFVLAGMTVIGAIILIGVTFLAVYIGCEAVWKAAGPKPAIQTCTRPYPHVCGVNGPCNGWKRRHPEQHNGEQ